MAPRSRPRYLAALALTVVVGLAVHLHGGFLGAIARDVLGDALWAAMMVWLVALLFPAIQPVALAAAALAVCYAVELSQLVRADWLDAIRATTLGHLVIGSDFDARDLLAYAAGVAAAVALDARMRLLRAQRLDRLDP